MEQKENIVKRRWSTVTDCDGARSHELPMPRFIALLRAVNLGPHGKIAMEDLRAICAEAGFAANSDSFRPPIPI